MKDTARAIPFINPEFLSAFTDAWRDARVAIIEGVCQYIVAVNAIACDVKMIKKEVVFDNMAESR